MLAQQAAATEPSSHNPINSPILVGGVPVTNRSLVSGATQSIFKGPANTEFVTRRHHAAITLIPTIPDSPTHQQLPTPPFTTHRTLIPPPSGRSSDANDPTARNPPRFLDSNNDTPRNLSRFPNTNVYPTRSLNRLPSQARRGRGFVVPQMENPPDNNMGL